MIEEDYFGEARGNAIAVVANTRAMREATGTDGPLDRNTLLAVQHTLLRHAEPAIAGQLRTDPVWNCGAKHAPVDALFVAPVHSRIEPALTDLLAFAVRHR